MSQRTTIMLISEANTNSTVMMRDRLKEVAHDLRNELQVYRMLARHHRTPRLAKVLLAAAVAYTLLPFDLIPDFVPVLGHLDDLIIVPALVVAALRLLPEGLLDECRAKLEAAGAAPSVLREEFLARESSP
jgi:uncharacterized membrane protein YkvA (DUF1232 family)